jgi:hypothetical protein
MGFVVLRGRVPSRGPARRGGRSHYRAGWSAPVMLTSGVEALSEGQAPLVSESGMVGQRLQQTSVLQVAIRHGQWASLTVNPASSRSTISIGDPTVTSPGWTTLRYHPVRPLAFSRSWMSLRWR